MAHEADGREDLTLEQFHELLDQHAREVKLGNVVPLTMEPTPPPQPKPRRKRWLRPLVLFLLTCWSTYYVGSFKTTWVNGVIYSASLMSILLFHEMGHYLQSLRYHVPASFPFFIPLPLPPIGTMGAVIFQQRGTGDRRALYDIAISGPLAGLVLALPAAYFGIQWSEVRQAPLNVGDYELGEPLIFQWMMYLIHGPLPEGQDLFLHPLAMAGWVGIFITALNLMPVSQLDGGHIAYALLRKRAHTVAMAFMSLVLVYMVWAEAYHWILMVSLLFLMGPRHPPTANDNGPLGMGRKILGWLTLLFFVIGFTPNPINIRMPEQPPQSQQLEL